MIDKKSYMDSRFFQQTIIVFGIVLWLYCVAFVTLRYDTTSQFMILPLVPLMIFISLFLNTFQLPSGLTFTRERVSLSFADSIVLLVAYGIGLAPAVFLAAIEGYFSTRRTSKWRTSLFSASMMAFSALAASLTINAVLNFDPSYQAATGSRHTLVVAVSLLAGSLVQMCVNVFVLSIFLSLRQNKSLLDSLRERFLMAASLLLPASTVANLLYLVFQYDMLLLIILAAPIFAAIYFGYRQYRTGVQQRIAIMEKAYHETIEALAVTINAKDEVTHEHVLRVQIYASGVAQLLGCKEEEVEALKAGALLHDIGKIAVPDHILNKPGKLTAVEFEKMKMHTLAGARILSRVEFPYPIVPIVRSHHEHWNGRGYPDGLKGEEIPLTARILSVVDCFDAVREDRQYRKGLTREQAIELILQGSGTQYDPRVVGIFLANLPMFEAEIQAQRNKPLPTYGIEMSEQLSEAARRVPPAAGLAETEKEAAQHPTSQFTKDELAAFYELNQAVNAASNYKELLSHFTAKLKLLVPFDLCSIALVHSKSGEWHIAHAEGEQAVILQGRNIAFNEGVTGWVLANRQAFCNTDPKLDLPPALPEHIATQFGKYRTLSAFPLLKAKELYGAIALYSATLKEYDAHHQELMKQATKIIADALSNTAKRAAQDAPPLSNLTSQFDSTKPFESTLTH